MIVVWWKIPTILKIELIVGNETPEKPRKFYKNKNSLLEKLVV